MSILVEVNCSFPESIQYLSCFFLFFNHFFLVFKFFNELFSETFVFLIAFCDCSLIDCCQKWEFFCEISYIVKQSCLLYLGADDEFRYMDCSRVLTPISSTITTAAAACIIQSILPTFSSASICRMPAIHSLVFGMTFASFF